MDYMSIKTIWSFTMYISYLVWIVCIISLVLNCTRRNIGKAIFAGVGLVVPIVSIIISTLGKGLSFRGEYTKEILLILALVMQIVTLIIAFIFCFSKNRKINQ